MPERRLSHRRLSHGRSSGMRLSHSNRISPLESPLAAPDFRINDVFLKGLDALCHKSCPTCRLRD